MTGDSREESVPESPEHWGRQVLPSPAPRLLSGAPDILLNVFLAIAVDNLANAQELTKVCGWVHTCGPRMGGWGQSMPPWRGCGVMRGPGPALGACGRCPGAFLKSWICRDVGALERQGTLCQEGG